MRYKQGLFPSSGSQVSGPRSQVPSAEPVTGTKFRILAPRSQVPSLSQVHTHIWHLPPHTRHLTTPETPASRRRDCSKPVRARANQEAFPASRIQLRRWNPECTLSILAFLHLKHATSDHTPHTSQIQPASRRLQPARKSFSQPGRNSSQPGHNGSQPSRKQRVGPRMHIGHPSFSAPHT